MAEEIIYPLISVLVANYNNAAYITDALDSARSQIYPNIEIVILDDCSTDDSLSVIHQYALQHSEINIVLSVNERNSGVGYTKRRLIELSHGEYFFFLDPDDTITADCIETLYKPYLHDNYSIVYASHYLCDEYLRIIDESNWVGQIPAGQTHFTSTEGHISAPALCNRSCYDETDGINPDYPVAEDQDLYTKMEEIAPVLYIDRPLYFYRAHNHNMSRDNAQQWLNLSAVHQYIEDNYRRRRFQHPEVRNLTLRQIAEHRLEYQLSKYRHYRSSGQYMKAVMALVKACQYCYYDRHLHILKNIFRF